MINIVHTWNFMYENDLSYELLLFIVWYFGSWLWTPRDHVIMDDIFMSSWMLSWPLQSTIISCAECFHTMPARYNMDKMHVLKWKPHNWLLKVTDSSLISDWNAHQWPLYIQGVPSLSIVWPCSVCCFFQWFSGGLVWWLSSAGRSQA